MKEKFLPYNCQSFIRVSGIGVVSLFPSEEEKVRGVGGVIVFGRGKRFPTTFYNLYVYHKKLFLFLFAVLKNLARDIVLPIAYYECAEKNTFGSYE